MSEERNFEPNDIEKQTLKNVRGFYRKVLIESQKSMKECEEKGIDITTIILDLLEELGFERKNEGTLYLEDVISQLYFERKAFMGTRQYFNFDDEKNNHYLFANEYYECGLNNLHESINEAIENSYVSTSSLNDIIYGVTNDVISQVDRPSKKLVYGQK